MTDHHKLLFLDILKRYRLAEASAEEIAFLEKYYQLFDANEEVELTDAEYSLIRDTIKARVDRQIAELSSDNATNEPEPSQTTKKLWPSWSKYAAAAAILMFLSTSIYLFRSQQTKDGEELKTSNDLAPGGNKAVLTLANGKKIVLDDAVNGEIAKESGISISKTKDGRIIYTVAGDNAGDDAAENNAVDNAAADQVAMNTITTPNGGKYEIILPDGSNVILNAASSLTFPTSFKGTERTVVLDGEAYFEVARNKAMPFKVKSGEQVVEVLGTHFNINAYADESVIKTTLLEGSVKVQYGIRSAMIKPGQQTLINVNDAKEIITRSANLEKETAWKNDAFLFEGDDLKSVMRQIARWYDAEVIYTGAFPDDQFFGGISRNSKLSAVAKILEYNNIRLRIIGKTIRVSYIDPAP